MKQIKKYFWCLFAIFMLISFVNIKSIAMDVKDVNMDETDISQKINSISVLAESDSETDPSETDNWELSLVFYDSTVDGGKTPLTEINWDASDGGYGEGESRVITVQINYKNTNAITTYLPGELEISIPNLIYNTSSNTENNPQWKSSVIVGANDSTHTGYAFNFNSEEKDNIYKFTNANMIEEKSNFDGSIQIVYSITPNNEIIEKYEEECTHSLEKELKASIKNIVESNEINIKYKRTYIHPWTHVSYFVGKSASKISSYDGLSNNASDYVWVKYLFSHSQYFYSSQYNYPYICCGSGYYKDKIPDDCIVLSENLEIMQPDEQGYYRINAYSDYLYYNNIYVGYP